MDGSESDGLMRFIVSAVGHLLCSNKLQVLGFPINNEVLLLMLFKVLILGAKLACSCRILERVLVGGFAL